MAFMRLQYQFIALPNNSARLLQLQYEYEALISKISDYYQVKKRLIDLQQQKLANDYENFFGFFFPVKKITFFIFPKNNF